MTDERKLDERRRAILAEFFDHRRATDDDRAVTALVAALAQAQHALEAALSKREQFRQVLRQTADRAVGDQQPLGCDISDSSDEWCAGFLDGQENALDYLTAALGRIEAERGRDG